LAKLQSGKPARVGGSFLFVERQLKRRTEPATPEKYDVTKKTRLVRRNKNGSYDRATVHDILDSGLICHLGFIVDGQPIVTPTSYWRLGESVFIHGSSASRTLKKVGDGLPVCLTVSHLDGIVHARSGFNSCLNYRAVMVFGSAVLVTDAEEKEQCLKGLLDRLAPGRSTESRPSTAIELRATSVLRLELNEVSAKVRTGGVGDDATELALDYWAGTVPIRMVVGEPVDDPDLRPGIARPDNIARVRIGR